MHVSKGRIDGPLFAAFVKAGRQAGYPYTDDLNGFQQEGFGPMDRTTRRGIRHSTSLAYLRPAKKRANLTVLTRALVTRLLQDGQRIQGVEYVRRGKTATVHARRETILAGGSINSPQLLMLSGIGPGDSLRALDIAVHHELPGVGQNLQDHLEITVQMECTQPVSIYRYYNLLGKAYVGARWLFTRTGIGATNQFEAGGFIRSRVGVPYPDLQYHFFPMAVRYDGKSPNDSHGFQAHVGPMRSKSTGCGHIALGESGRRAAHSVQLHAAERRLGGVSRRHSPDARGPRAGGLPAVCRQGAFARTRTCRATATSMRG